MEALLNKPLLILILLLLQKLSQETDAVLAGQVSTELAFILGRFVFLSLIKRLGLKNGAVLYQDKSEVIVSTCKKNPKKPIQ